METITAPEVEVAPQPVIHKRKLLYVVSPPYLTESGVLYLDFLLQVIQEHRIGVIDSRNLAPDKRMDELLEMQERDAREDALDHVAEAYDRTLSYQFELVDGVVALLGYNTIHQRVAYVLGRAHEQRKPILAFQTPAVLIASGMPVSEPFLDPGARAAIARYGRKVNTLEDFAHGLQELFGRHSEKE